MAILRRTVSSPAWALLAVLLVSITGCGGDATTTDPTVPRIDGAFAVDGNRKLAIRCWGYGSPTVVFDAGSGASGLEVFGGSPIISSLARRTRVCTYDRAGLGLSDPAPRRMRGLDDAVDDLDALLSAAGVDPPFVLVGSSGGGFNVYQYAGRHREDVAGLVMLDVPGGNANLLADDVPAWNAPDNPERMDYLAIERQMALARLSIGAIPVTVVYATRGQSGSPDEQRVWLEGSSDPQLVVLEGGHDIYVDDPQGVLAEIQGVVDATG